jgi:hypothetical protein
MSHAAQVLNRAGKLMFAVILLSLLVAILFGSFGLILPRHQWTVWRVPILTAAGITVTLMIAWANYSAARSWIIDGLAALLGLTSAILGIAITLLIAYGLNLHIIEHSGSRNSFVYKMTDSAILWYLLCCAFIPTVPGAVGVWMARRRLREAGRTSLPGMAARFSTLGLGLSAMIGVMVAVAAIYRRVTWP